MKKYCFVAVLFLSAFQALAAQRFLLSSPDFPDGGKLPEAALLNGFGCNGGNRSPALSWTDPPSGTQSLAITLHDQDAPTGSGFWHWVVVGLPPRAGTLAADAGNIDNPALPAGAVMARTDYGVPAFGGACPPAGAPAHHYVFSIHALDVADLGAPLDVSAAMVGFFLNAHSLAVARTTAIYGR